MLSSSSLFQNRSLHKPKPSKSVANHHPVLNPAPMLVKPPVVKRGLVWLRLVVAFKTFQKYVPSTGIDVFSKSIREVQLQNPPKKHQKNHKPQKPKKSPKIPPKITSKTTKSPRTQSSSPALNTYLVSFPFWFLSFLLGKTTKQSKVKTVSPLTGGRTCCSFSSSRAKRLPERSSSSRFSSCVKFGSTDFNSLPPERSKASVGREIGLGIGAVCWFFVVFNRVKKP